MKAFLKHKYFFAVLLSFLLIGFTEKNQKHEFNYYWFLYYWGHPQMAWSYHSPPTDWIDSDAAFFCMGDGMPCAAKFASNYEGEPMDPGISFEEQDWW
jgi:hypothetical protein